jgi:hypothetical protein
MKKLFATLTMVSAVLLPACSSSSGNPLPAVAPPGGTATEQKLCVDLRAKAPDATITADANAVNNDMTTGTGNLALEVGGYLASVGGYGLKSVQWEREKMLHDCASGQF